MSENGRWPILRWMFLVLSVATVLTNAYFLRFLEPTVSRKTLAILLLAITALMYAARRTGVPRSRGDLAAVARRWVTPAVLFLILAVGFGFRAWGITSGLPQSYVSDEYDYVHASLKMMKRGDLNPRWWHYPSLQPYLALGTYSTVFLWEARNGRWQSVHQIAEEDMLYWGRFVGVVFGTAAILVTFFLGRFLFGTGAGLMAAAFLAVFPGAIEHSQVNKPDPVLVFMTVLAVFVALLYFRDGGKRLAILSGVVIGLSVATKYNGVLVVLPFLLAATLRHRGRVLAEPDVYLGGLAALLGFFAACPFVLADLSTFLDHVAAELYAYGFAGKPGSTGENNWYQHARYTLLFGAGTWMSLAVLGGLGLALYRIDGRMSVALVFPIVYFSFLSSQRVHWSGNLIPVYPFLAVLAAYGVREATRGFVHQLRAARPEARLARFQTSIASATTGVLLALLLWFPLGMAIRYNVQATLPDTGTRASEWIDGHFPPGTSFAVERHAPVPDRDRFRVTVESRIIHRSVSDYRDDGIQNLIVSSMVYQRFGPDHRITRAYEKLFQICPVVAEFEPVKGRIQGPTIRILRVPPLEEDSSGW